VDTILFLLSIVPSYRCYILRIWEEQIFQDTPHVLLRGSTATSLVMKSHDGFMIREGIQREYSTYRHLDGYYPVSLSIVPFYRCYILRIREEKISRVTEESWTTVP
jgi:hypothetical protein